MAKQFETLVGLIYNLQDHHGFNKDINLYKEIKDGLRQPSYFKRIGDVMKLEETTVKGDRKEHIITKITTIDYTLYQLEHRLLSKEELNG